MCSARQLVLLDRADQATLLQDDDAIGHRNGLVKLVRDEDDGEPFALEPTEDLGQLSNTLRRQHRRRLVEDQDAGASPESLDDLDLLLLAESEGPGLRIRVDLDSEHRRELVQPRPGAAFVESET